MIQKSAVNQSAAVVITATAARAHLRSGVTLAVSLVPATAGVIETVIGTAGARIVIRGIVIAEGMTEEMKVAETETAPGAELDVIEAEVETGVDIAAVAREGAIVTTDLDAVAVGGTIEIGDAIGLDPAIAVVVANL